MKLNRLILAILVFFQHPVLADIVTDGSVGPAAQSINAIDGQFIIDQELGNLKGENLFHSFEQFNIQRNETATFTGDDTVQNVISRVTGGNESRINGILRSEVGSADFYFINPAGVVFEENSQIDVPASFHISTAGELTFADGSSFSALNPEASTLTVATPETFGFTSGQNGSLEIIGGQLKFKPGTDVSLSANNLDIQQNASITADTAGRRLGIRLGPAFMPGLHLNLAVIDSSTTKNIPANNFVSTSATGGELSVENSTIDVSGNGAGRVTIRAGTMTMTGSMSDVLLKGLFANNEGIQDAREDNRISIDVDSLHLEDALISSQALNNGDGGEIEINAKQLKISGFFGGIFTGTEANGIPGKITVNVSGAIQIINRGKIISQAAGPGDGGIIDVTAGQLTIDGSSPLNVTASQISSSAFEKSKSNAGSITIEVANMMQLLNHGGIYTSSAGGDGGDITITSGKWNQLKNNGQMKASVEGKESKAGDIKIKAPVLILDAGQILNKTGTVSKSQGGDINIDPQTQIVGGFDLVRKANSINVISADSGIVSVGPAPNLAADLVGIIAPNLDIEGINQDPCTHGNENSLKSLGHGGAPAFQHGENYLTINRFDESERDPVNMDTLQIMPIINTDYESAVTDCDKPQRTSLN